MVLLKVLAPAFFARGDTSTPVKVGMITLALNFGLNLLFNAGIVAPEGAAPWLPRLELIGPPLATSMAAMFNLGCLGVLLARRGIWWPMRRCAAACRAWLLAAAGMAATLWIAERLLFAPGPHGTVGPGWMGHGVRWAALAALVGLGGGVYLLAGQLLGAFDARDTLRLLSRRALRRRDGSAISPTADR